MYGVYYFRQWNGDRICNWQVHIEVLHAYFYCTCSLLSQAILRSLKIECASCFDYVAKQYFEIGD